MKWQWRVTKTVKDDDNSVEIMKTIHEKKNVIQGVCNKMY